MYRHTSETSQVWFQIATIEQYCNEASCTLCIGGGLGLQFRKNATPVKCIKVKCSKMRNACVLEKSEKAQPSKEFIYFIIIKV